MNLRAKQRALLVVSCLAATPALGTTYYISPNGNDSNIGTNSASPWGSVAKIDSTVFKPGDQILFQYGSTWNASLTATSSGTTGAPIVYGAYGNPTLGNPTFTGSDPVSPSAFTPVAGTTYTTISSTPVNWVYSNHNLQHEAQDVLSQAQSPNANDPATDVSYVENNPGSFYFNAGNGQLFVNTGTTPQAISLGTRQDAIYSNQKNNLIFQNLNTADTAADNAGYGIRMENSSNVKLLNATVTNSGKHGVGVIDTVGFTGTNLVANGSQPDLGFGGASAFVAYGDANSSIPTGVNNTSKWTNISYVHPFGAYPVFISHGNPGGVAAVTINNVVSTNGYGTGIQVFDTGDNERTIINGGHLDGNQVAMDTDYSVINGLAITGTTGYASAYMDCQHSVIQNLLMTGMVAVPQAGQFGSIIDNGANNTIRFNIAFLGDPAAGVGLTNPGSKTNIYGNILLAIPNTPSVGIGLFNDGTFVEKSNYNVFTPTAAFLVYPSFTYISPQQWLAMGYDANSAFGTPVFNDPTNGDYSLQSNSSGIGIYPGGLDPALTIANSFVGFPLPNGNFSAGLNSVISNFANTLSGGVLLNNGQMSVVTPTGNTLTIQPTGSILVLAGSSLDLAGTVINNGSLVCFGEFLETGNLTNHGAVIITGAQTWSPGTTFTNLSGYATIQSDTGGAVAPAEYLAFNVSGGTVTFTSTQHLSGLTVGPAGKVQMTSLCGAGRSILYTPSLSVTGILDLSNSDMIVEGGSVATITSLIKQGYNPAGDGKWDGTGIISSAAAADTTHLTTLGVMLNSTDGVTPLYNSGSALGLFDGASPNPNDVLVKYTYFGDANLDGKVDGSDYARIDNGLLLNLTGWSNGDFNYDGIINGSDYTLIDNAFNMQGQAIGVTTTSEIAASSVPEPTALGCIALTASLVLSRRRNRRVEVTPA